METDSIRDQAFAAIEDLNSVSEVELGINVSFPQGKSLNAIYDELITMQVALDPNPLDTGPQQLNKKIAVARNFLNRCEEFYLTIARHMAFWRRLLREETVKVELKKKWMIANDPQVRAGRSTTDRDALAHMVMLDQIKLIKKLEGIVEDLDMVLLVIRAKRSDLKDLLQQIKNQIKLCFEGIHLGETWGPYPIEGTNEVSTEQPIAQVLANVNRELRQALRDDFSAMDHVELEDVLGLPKTDPDDHSSSK